MINRSVYALALCLLSSAATYGIDSCITLTGKQLKHAARVIGADVKTAAHTTGLLAAHIGQKVVASASKAANTIATNYQTAKTNVQNTCQTIINSERVKVAQAFANAKINETRAYIKENPGKTALMTIGATAVACAVYCAIQKIRRAIKRYHADHATFCNCCGREIVKKETRYKDPQQDFQHYGYYLCPNCNDRIVYGANNTIGAYWRVRNN